MNQQQVAELFSTSKPNISMHIANILRESELAEDSVVKNFLTTAADGKSYNVIFYSLEMIIAVGYRVRGVRGTQFRQWATEHLTEYLVKGFTMDDERLTDWRTSGGCEVDAIIGEGRVAIEIKATEDAKSRHAHGLKAFGEDFPEARQIIVSLDKYRRKMNGVDIIPATEFLRNLWQGGIV